MSKDLEKNIDNKEVEEVKVRYDESGLDEKIIRAVTEMGFECIKPQGAFYLFVKSPFENEKKFCDLAKKYHIIVVPGSAFACPGYVRMAYCVSYETIVNSLPEFKKLMEEIKSMK